jgi:copper chaperone CopZ
MKTLSFILASTLILGACSSEPNVVHLRTEKGQKETKAPVNANSVLTMEIDGMTCEMGCGGSIRKELKASGAVARVEFIDFTEGQKTQTAKVSFDSTKITSDELVKIVSTINDKQFKVGKTTTDALATNAETTETSISSETEEEEVELSESSFAIPNLLDILSGFVL